MYLSKKIYLVYTQNIPYKYTVYGGHKSGLKHFTNNEIGQNFVSNLFYKYYKSPRCERLQIFYCNLAKFCKKTFGKINFLKYKMLN